MEGPIPLPPGNGGKSSDDTQPPKAFPAALGGPLCRAASRPIPSIRSSLWMRAQFYFRFIGFTSLH